MPDQLRDRNRDFNQSCAAWRRWLACAVLLFSAGCVSTEAAMDILIRDQTQYNDRKEARKLDEETWLLAEQAWSQAHGKGAPASLDYERGFKEGFADYLRYGGRGIPPALPPRDYWQSKYQSHTGKEAINLWFEGFRHGAQLAKASGLRQRITVPVAGFGPTAPPIDLVPTADVAIPIPQVHPQQNHQLPTPSPAAERIERLPPCNDTDQEPTLQGPRWQEELPSPENVPALQISQPQPWSSSQSGSINIPPGDGTFRPGSTQRGELEMIPPVVDSDDPARRFSNDSRFDDWAPTGSQFDLPASGYQPGSIGQPPHSGF